MEELKIVPPEGYEVDKKNSTFEKIVFKEISTDMPKSWNAFCQHSDTLGEYYINKDSNIEKLDFNFKRTDLDKNLCKYRTDAEAFLALIQLRRLWWEWKDEKKGCEMRYSFSICPPNDWRISVGGDKTVFPCYFYSEELAKKFLKTFKNLFNKVKILYQ